MARNSIIGWIVKKLKGNMALVEDSTTASQNISANKYVVFQGVLCTADAAISQGDTLATSGAGKNLTEVTGGGFNELNGYIANLGRTLIGSLRVTSGAVGNRVEVDITLSDTSEKGILVIVVDDYYAGNSTHYKNELYLTAATFVSQGQKRFSFQGGRFNLVDDFMTITYVNSKMHIQSQKISNAAITEERWLEFSVYKFLNI